MHHKLLLTQYETDANNLTAENIWEYVNRSLTFYEAPNVTALAPEIIDGIWNAPDRNLTYYEDVGSNLTASDIWDYNRTVNSNILSQFSTSIWNFFNSTSNFISLITESVWNRSDRNLTYYEQPNQKMFNK